MTLRTSLIVLGAAGTMMLGTPLPSMAQGVYVQAPGVEFGIGAPTYRHRGDFRAFAHAPRYRTGRRGITRYERPGMSWDSYGKRWDGGD